VGPVLAPDHGQDLALGQLAMAGRRGGQILPIAAPSEATLNSPPASARSAIIWSTGRKPVTFRSRPRRRDAAGAATRDAGSLLVDPWPRRIRTVLHEEPPRLGGLGPPHTPTLGDLGQPTTLQRDRRHLVSRTGHDSVGTPSHDPLQDLQLSRVDCSLSQRASLPSSPQPTTPFPRPEHPNG
jgi:hypothetical protein